jgi:hypothetical protein
MNRLAALKRICAVYGMIEEIHSIEARVASAEVRVVETAIDAETSLGRRARTEERVAMTDEDALRRSAMSAEDEMATRRKAHLQPILERRQEFSEEARRRHVASRMWNERIKSLIDAEADRIAVDRERRAQAASDDRFLVLREAKKKTNTGKQ